jgi:hypothetical protein
MLQVGMLPAFRQTNWTDSPKLTVARPSIFFSHEPLAILSYNYFRRRLKVDQSERQLLADCRRRRGGYNEIAYRSSAFDEVENMGQRPFISKDDFDDAMMESARREEDDRNWEEEQQARARSEEERQQRRRKWFGEDDEDDEASSNGEDDYSDVDQAEQAEPAGGQKFLLTAAAIIGIVGGAFLSTLR